MRTRRGYYEVVSGDAHDEISVIYTGQGLLLRSIFIENDEGERDVLRYVPQSLKAHENEPSRENDKKSRNSGSQLPPWE
jgi:hypothetical protein